MSLPCRSPPSALASCLHGPFLMQWLQAGRSAEQQPPRKLTYEGITQNPGRSWPRRKGNGNFGSKLRQEPPR